MNKTLRMLLSGLVIAILALAAVPAADAASIKLTTDLGATVTIDDEGAGDAAPGTGVVAFFGEVGVFEFTGTLGVTKPLAGSAELPQMVLILNTTSTDGGVLQVQFSETDFGSTGVNVFVEAGGAAAGSLLHETYQDPGNALFGNTVLLTTNATGSGPYVFVNAGSLATGAAPYSLMQQVTLSHTGAGQTTTFEGTLAVAPFETVPDGGWAISLLGFGLIGVEGLRRRFTRL